MSLSVWKSLHCTVFQIANLEQQVLESSERLKSAEQQITEKQQHVEKLVSPRLLLDHETSQNSSAMFGLF